MSRIALLSDIHANYPALKRIVAELEKESPDVWICLGDFIGYGPHPKECISLIREKNMICVLGNHDAGVVDKLPLDHFRNPNKKLIKITQKLLTEDQKTWLKELPLTVESEEGEWIAAHASPEHPSRWEYLESAFKMRPMLESMNQQFCFIGHTHRPALVSDTIGTKEFKSGHKYFINPGSVGQPRDGDQRACSAFVDTQKYTYKTIRAEFEIGKVLMDLENLGFSRNEAEHLMRTS